MTSNEDDADDDDDDDNDTDEHYYDSVQIGAGDAEADDDADADGNNNEMTKGTIFKGTMQESCQPTKQGLTAGGAFTSTQSGGSQPLP